MRNVVIGVLLAMGLSLDVQADDAPSAPFRAGAAIVEVSPRVFPVLVNGGFLQAQASAVRDPLHARALVLDDGSTRLAIVVVDSCMMPRELIDRAKTLAHERVGIPTDRILVSATHTHSAPASMGALGCAVDETYADELPPRIAESIVQAVGKLTPARIGWGSVVDDAHTHNRRWIRRPDRLMNDPFGRASVRAHMHPGYLSPDVVGPSGPVDPQLSIVSVQTREGRPIALLANYSMHYFGTAPVSADYFSRFCTAIQRAAGGDNPDFVAIMSQGTSGDQHWMDYGQARKDVTIDAYADAVARSALDALKSVTYRDHAPLAMAETTLHLRRRVPDAERLAWAWRIVSEMGNRPPKNQPEVYAREAFYLRDAPKRYIKLQAIRIGDLGITAIPNEVYALTGLKIKARSPLSATFTIELANGGEGYIPPPEQHALGGYTTWPARTAALEVAAEPRIVETVLELLETVAGRSRTVEQPPSKAHAATALALKPWGYWPLDDMDGAQPRDLTGNPRRATLEPGFALYLDGADATSRAVHLAGGRLRIDPSGLGASHTVAFRFWNGLPTDLRPVTGVLLDAGPSSLRVSLDGTTGKPGVIALGGLSAPVVRGSTVLPMRTWHHLAVVHDGNRTRVWLDGQVEAEADAPPSGSTRDNHASLHLGGSDDRDTRLEGKVDDLAIFDRALTESEIRRLANSRSTGDSPRP